ncbi:hypothetical protein HMPREF1988_00393 [Porphyromonas gingivalis F0185]|nr:hypothetical protein HMPREF1988_00393 [Porphyromonas gingivalis F0185]
MSLSKKRETFFTNTLHSDFFVACRRSVAHYTNTAVMAIKLWLKAG